MKYLLDTNVCIKFINGTSDKIKNKIASLKPEDIFYALSSNLNYIMEFIKVKIEKKISKNYYIFSNRLLVWIMMKKVQKYLEK